MQYEMTFIVFDEDKSKIVKKILEEAGAKILFENSIGRRIFTYPIKKEKAGFYHNLYFNVEASEISVIDKALRTEKEIARYLIIKNTQKIENVIAKIDRMKQKKTGARHTEIKDDKTTNKTEKITENDDKQKSKDLEKASTKTEKAKTKSKKAETSKVKKVDTKKDAPLKIKEVKKTKIEKAQESKKAEKVKKVEKIETTQKTVAEQKKADDQERIKKLEEKLNELLKD